MASNLCNIAFTWVSDRSPSAVSKFTYLDVTDLKEPGSGNGDTPTGWNRCTEEIGSGSDTELWLTRDDLQENSNHCVLQLTCPNPEFACVNGFYILSESRTLEISSEVKGYLATVRGRKVDEKLPNNSHISLYLCSYYSEERFDSLRVKFLSLGERLSFCVQRVGINIVQHGINHSPRTSGSSLDVSKLKRDIEDMGSTMSDRAKDFMATLEQYEKNKISNMSGLLSTSNMLSSSNGSNMNGLSSIMSGILGAGTIKALGGSAVPSDGDHQDIYKILNSVCGSISSRRVASVKQAEISSDSSMDATPQASNTSSMPGTNSFVSQETADLMMKLVTEEMEGFKSKLHTDISDLRQEMLTKIEDVRLELNQKLDLVLSLLRNVDLVTDKT